ncbi:ARF-like 2-binding protein BART protein (macronuclear) [Tetrahymena thermophila SB210]|uniref:Cilia- and flagella-associated protein 36 n=1 Tax=Tetrahymena thermophila (strain SB210) TaxID=312017 RepID=Q23GD8_TETTS|nr:ARF-like 2-binding protein BART protein [Tetrahymena thermophila SB210]EAR95322.2 ARF-like 2-binding protein BART protein [Tetrahymena thermophila SB210]|eukprot:XP_001015567.2 ARF-like 2-binding protein BART protein [Tetrahymena thermophila SB210]
MGWFTKSKDKKKKEEEEKKKKEAELKQANEKKLQEEQKQNFSNRKPADDEPEQQQEFIKEEDVWIFESILQFLVSPVFKAPVHQMIDDKCIYFEDIKNISNDHKEIHQEYKNMLNELIIGLSQDIGAEPGKIMELCEHAVNLRSHRKYFVYFQLYYHLDDFVKMMAKRNVDLETEALRQLQKKNQGSNQQRGMQFNEQDEYERAIQNSLSNTQNIGGDELQRAILASQQEFENKKKLQDQEDEMLQQALRISKMENEGKQNKVEFQNGHVESKKIHKPQQKGNDDDDDLIQINDSDDDLGGDDDDDNLYFDFKKDKNEQQQKPDQNFDKMLFESRQNLLKNLDNLNINQNNSSSQQQAQQQPAETLEERKERLKKQREMLLEKKRMERANELDEYADKQNQELLNQDDDEDDTKSQMEIKKKKELVNKIKAEIAGNK